MRSLGGIPWASVCRRCRNVPQPPHRGLDAATGLQLTPPLEHGVERGHRGLPLLLGPPSPLGEDDGEGNSVDVHVEVLEGFGEGVETEELVGVADETARFSDDAL